MKISTKNLKKLDASIASRVIDLIDRAAKVDGRREYGTGYVQSAVIAELFAELYNSPDSKIPSSDTMQIAYKRKDKRYE
jgi:hypothetical protein